MLSRIVEGLENAVFAELHWLLKRLDQIKTDNPTGRISVALEFLRSIPPERLAHWISTKSVRINELRFVFKVGRLLKLGAENGDVMLYPDYLQAHLSVECLRRILVGQRSQLYDIAITSKFGHELLAYQLLHCAKDGSLAKKVASEDSIFRINQSIQLLEEENLRSKYRRSVRFPKRNGPLSSAALSKARPLINAR